MEDEFILVQSNGVAQWLKMAMADDSPAESGAGWGIAFGNRVMLPARFQWFAYRAVLERDAQAAIPETSPFDRSCLRWLLMKRLPELLGKPDFSPLRDYLQDDSKGRKRWQLAEKLADLYDQYQVYRSDWLQAWSSGNDVLILPTGEESPLDNEQIWQAQLWRDLLSSVAPQARATHRAAIHARFLAVARQLTPQTLPDRLPRRLVVFGISSMPQQLLESLAALSGAVQIMVCMVNPCRYYWGDLIEHRELLRKEYQRQQRRPCMPAELDDESIHQHAHPLLAAWGKQGRDYLHMIDVHDQTNAYAHLFQDAGLQIDVFESPPTANLLGQLQEDILELRSLTQTRDKWPAVDPQSDASIVFHIAHSPQREMEVLHDQLLAAFSGSDELRPEDIIVMVPDVDSMAPHIHAVFGQFEAGASRHIPYQIADRKQRQQAPLLIALEQLLSLPTMRFKVSEIMALLGVAAIRQRFEIGEADLPQLRQWIKDANIRWGLDAEHRKNLGLPDLDGMYTWRFGLRRMLYGYAMGHLDADLPAPDGIVPFDQVAGLNAALVGPLERLIETLASFREQLARDHRPVTWVQCLHGLLDACFLARAAEEDRLIGLLTEALDAWLTECNEAGFDEPLPLDVVRDAWLQQVDRPGLAQRFGGGAVTFATLMPMRAIPFRQICLVGLNDADYPRRNSRPDFDLMSMRGHFRPGDRSRREDDRYLFLEALLAARDVIYLSWSGRSQQDNSALPPSVLVSQLRDHIANGWRLLDGDTDSRKAGQQLLDALTTEHPLQPFSRDYFTRPATAASQQGASQSPMRRSRRFTYAAEWAVAVDAAINHEIIPAGVVTATLPPWVPDAELSLRQLADFLRDPVRELFRQRLQIYFSETQPETLDEEPFSFAGGLEKWQQQDALLQPVGFKLAVDQEFDPLQRLHSIRQQRQRSGAYPVGAFGTIKSKELAEPLQDALQQLKLLMKEYSHRVDPLPDIDLSISTSAAVENSENNATSLLQLTDVVDGVWKDDNNNHACFVLETSKPADEKTAARLSVIARHWPAHLALQGPVGGAPTYIIGPSGVVVLPILAAECAQELLAELLKAWSDGMRTPFPVTADIAEAALVAASDVDIADLDESVLLENRNLQTKTDQALTPGSAFARQFDSLESLVRQPQFREIIKRIYLPLYRRMHAASGDEL